MKLHVETSGDGPALVLLHGWGLNSGVWNRLVSSLTEHYRLVRIDLPGHGRSAMSTNGYTLDTLATAVVAHLPAESVVLGWSLGGLVALRLALNETPIRRLILTGTSPQFVADTRWPHAMAPEVLENFATQLLADHAGTIRRFLALQALGCADSRHILSELKNAIAAAPPPDADALAGGLEILRTTSLLADLPALRLPVTLIHGEHDTLAPLAAAHAMAERIPDACLHTIPGAGHAPFISHADTFLNLLREAINDND